MRRSTSASVLAGFASVVLACVPAALAQEGVAAAVGRGPQFLLATAQSSQPPTPVDAASVPVLRRRVSLDLGDVDRAEALSAISRASGLRLVYANGVVPREGRVRLRVEEITVAAALTEVLLDAGVDVLLAPGGNAVLVKRAAERVPAIGTITGRVTDAKTADGLAAAEVYLEDTRWRTRTGEDGRYRLAEVEAGSYTLVVRRIGYAKRSQAVTAVEGEEVAVDVALEPVATRLDEIVTTVTGEQRLRELGHVVGRINADSVVREAPVSTVTELLTARIPGLLVQPLQGTVGGEVSLRIRGANSTALTTEPIIIIDGIRYTSNPRAGPSLSYAVSPFMNEATSRLNDLNPNDLESVEVVKGPSAATLYGTDAANGVIVITTKQGRPGPARWNAYARATISGIPEHQYPDSYWGWGSGSSNCFLFLVTLGACAQDSVSVIANPLNDPALTIFGNQPRWELGTSVSGGSRALQYYFSTDIEDATGPVQLPPTMIDAIKARRGVSELPDEQLRPNAATKLNLASTVTALLSEKAWVRVNMGYTRNATRTLTLSNPYRVSSLGTPTGPFPAQADPENAFSQTSTERINRFLGSATAEWRPRQWLLARGTVGIDLATSSRYSLARAGEAPISSPRGIVGDDRTRYLVSTADLGTTAFFRFGSASSRTSAGAQYVRTLHDGLSSVGLGLPPGGSSVGDASSLSVGQNYQETVTLGSYLEQTFGLNDRLFLTSALRVDGASGFGRAYAAVVYPKVGASWVLSEEPFLPRLPGLDELRLRYAFGAAGQQPWPVWTRPIYQAGNGLADGQVGSILTVGSIGNPDLRPERVSEHEFGLDASVLDRRAHLTLTWNRRKTADQLQVIQLPPGLGSIWTNVGLIRGSGFEAQLTARVLDARALTVDVAASHAWHTDEVLDLGGGVPRYQNDGGYAEGYPIGARFARPLLGFNDTNGNGIIELDEVEVGESPVYVGRSVPPRTQTLSMALGLLAGRLRVSALLDRQSGFTQIDGLWLEQCASFRCRGLVDPSTPLAGQAEAIALLAAGGTTTYGRSEPGDFSRLREVTVALDWPAGLVRALRLSRASLSVSARNLALWSSFSGADPESGLFGEGIPQARSWAFRLDVGL